MCVHFICDPHHKPSVLLLVFSISHAYEEIVYSDDARSKREFESSSEEDDDDEEEVTISSNTWKHQVLHYIVLLLYLL